MVNSSRQNPERGWETAFQRVPGGFDPVIPEHFSRRFPIRAREGRRRTQDPSKIRFSSGQESGSWPRQGFQEYTECRLWNGYGYPTYLKSGCGFVQKVQFLKCRERGKRKSHRPLDPIFVKHFSRRFRFRAPEVRGRAQKNKKSQKT